MNKLDPDFNSMSIATLWTLREEIESILCAKMEAEKLKLERRLAKLDRKFLINGRRRLRYPKVLPQFRNPDPPHETWSGRGKQPHWMRKLISNGKSKEDFRT